MAGAAGSGAEDMARRAAAREARLAEQLAQARRRRASWEAGAAGERAVATVLDGLAAEGWRALHDVHWPGRPHANIDHIAVGPGGVVVIDSKNWAGPITVRNGVLHQAGRSRASVVPAEVAAVAAVTALLPAQHRRCVRATVCFVQQELSAFPLGLGVAGVGLAHLAQLLRNLPTVMHSDDVQRVEGVLAVLTGPRSPEQTTTSALSGLPPAPWAPRLGPAPSTPASRPAPRARRPEAPPRPAASPGHGASVGSARASGRRGSRRRRTGSNPVGALAGLVAMAVAWWLFAGVVQKGPDVLTDRPPVSTGSPGGGAEAPPVAP